MPSEFFDKMVEQLQGTVLEQTASETITEHAKLIGKDPETLCQEDGSHLIMKLMSNVSCALPKEEWNKLDAKLKGQVDDPDILTGKVKGYLMNSIYDFIKLKRGEKGLQALIRILRTPPKFRTESWYPVFVLDDLLIYCAKILEKDDDEASYEVGCHITYRDTYSKADHLFKSGSPGLKTALKNLDEVFQLDHFRVTDSEAGYELTYDGASSERLNRFFMGTCEAICRLRKVDHSGIGTADDKRGRKVIKLWVNGGAS